MFFETGKDTTKVCLAAESFGSRLCYAEKTQFTPRENEVLRPAKISDCVFVINQALSLRALQEILTHAKSQQEVRIPTLNGLPDRLCYGPSALNLGKIDGDGCLVTWFQNDSSS